MSEKTKAYVYKLAYQNGYSLNEMMKIIIRDRVHKEFPGEEIE